MFFLDNYYIEFLQVYKLPKNQKMAKLGMYSACQFPECRCINWKTPEENRHRDVESNYCPQFSDPCRNPDCKHSLGKNKNQLSKINTALIITFSSSQNIMFHIWVI